MERERVRQELKRTNSPDWLRTLFQLVHVEPKAFAALVEEYGSHEEPELRRAVAYACVAFHFVPGLERIAASDPDAELRDTVRQLLKEGLPFRDYDQLGDPVDMYQSAFMEDAAEE